MPTVRDIHFILFQSRYVVVNVVSTFVTEGCGCLLCVTFSIVSCLMTRVANLRNVSVEFRTTQHTKEQLHQLSRTRTEKMSTT
jgi:hypothetical protein